jgi:hypothetical protein
VHVSPLGTDMVQCGTEEEPCKTIQYGLDLASNYDTVKIAAGTYVENITLNRPIKNLTLQCGWNTDFSAKASTPGNTILTPQYSNNITLSVQVGLLTSTDITVEGCLITGGKWGIAMVNNGGSLTTTIKNTHLTENSSDGIKIMTYTGSSSSVSISQCAAITGNGNGIYIYNSGTSSATDLSVSSNQILNNAEAGIRVDAYSKSQVSITSSNNNIIWNGDSGISLYTRHSNSSISGTLTNETIVSNSDANGAGLEAHADESAGIDVTVRNAVIWGNKRDIIAYAEQMPGFIATTAVRTSYSDVGEILRLPVGTYIEGVGNLNVDPKLMSNYHLSRNSPLIDAGQCGTYLLSIYRRIAPYSDIDGQSRPGFGETTGCDIGADERHSSQLCFPVKNSSGEITIICMEK